MPSRREEIETLSEICHKRGQNLTAEYLVEAAKDAETYPFLHKHLWGVDSETLAQEARLIRAHQLIITLTVTVGDGLRTRQLMHIRGVQGYQPYTEVIKNPDLASVKLRQLTEDIGRARAKLRSFREALPDDVSDEIDAALERAEASTAAALEKRLKALGSSAA